jgi:hypothetical protein
MTQASPGSDFAPEANSWRPARRTGTWCCSCTAFPYDVHSYVDGAPRLAAAGCRVVVTALRRALLSGALLLLVLAAAVLLVLTLQQVRDSRRHSRCWRPRGGGAAVGARPLRGLAERDPRRGGRLLADAAGAVLSVLLLRVAGIPGPGRPAAGRGPQRGRARRSGRRDRALAPGRGDRHPPDALWAE